MVKELLQPCIRNTQMNNKRKKTQMESVGIHMQTSLCSPLPCGRQRVHSSPSNANVSTYVQYIHPGKPIRDSVPVSVCWRAGP